MCGVYLMGIRSDRGRRRGRFLHVSRGGAIVSATRERSSSRLQRISDDGVVSQIQIARL